MSDHEPIPDEVDLDRGKAGLDAAAGQLRDAADPPRAGVAERVLGRSLATPRRTRLVRAHDPYDFLQVSTLVITSVLRERLDVGLPGAAVADVVCEIGAGGGLVDLTIELYVQYGSNVPETADRARELAGQVLASVLGPAGRGSDPAVAARSHVHVSDVTVGDPQLVEPFDEP